MNIHHHFFSSGLSDFNIDKYVVITMNSICSVKRHWVSQDYLHWTLHGWQNSVRQSLWSLIISRIVFTL
jgi:hypothetical protein